MQEPHNILKVLGHKDRYNICTSLLKNEEQNITQLIQVTGRAQAIVSQYVNELSNANIINKRKVGTVVFCSLTDQIKPVIAGLNQLLRA